MLLEKNLVPSPEAVPWPRFAKKVLSRSSSASSQDFELVLGPRSCLPARLSMADPSKLKMTRNHVVSAVSCSSSANCIRYSDYRRLTAMYRAGGPEISFGSALHVGDGKNAMCLVCSVLVARKM